MICVKLILRLVNCIHSQIASLSEVYAPVRLTTLLDDIEGVEY